MFTTGQDDVCEGKMAGKLLTRVISKTAGPSQRLQPERRTCRISCCSSGAAGKQRVIFLFSFNRMRKALFCTPLTAQAFLQKNVNLVF